MKRKSKSSRVRKARPDGTNQINTAYSNEPNRNPVTGIDDGRKRGLEVYTLSQLMRATGRDQDGRLLTWGVEQPYFFLTAMQRNEIFKLATPVFGIVTSRMNRISAIDFNVVPTKNSEDRIADHLKGVYQIYREYSNLQDLSHLAVRARCVNIIKSELPDVLYDLSNFNNSLLRWKKAIANKHTVDGEEIKEWLMEPNNGVTWTSYIKKLVYNLMVHGCDGTYKQVINNRLENFDCLPGGTVYKFKAPYFSGTDGYIQMVAGYEPQMLFANELSFSEYMPTSCQNYSMVPVEALINKIAEGLLFDRLMAEQADGTVPPQKLVIVTSGNANPFGDFDKDDQIPMEASEQKRLQQTLNEPIKYGIRVMSGNKAELIDLTKENTMETQRLRQKDIREEVALVFNATNMEMNLSGSDQTSGRSTSEAQSDIEQGKGIGPVLKIIEGSLTKNIIPHRAGFGFKFEFMNSKNETDEEMLDKLRLGNGKITVNELREENNLPTFDKPEYDYPQGAGAPQVPGADVNSPLFTKPL